MTSFEVTRQNKLFPLESNGNNPHGFTINDPILSDCIGRGRGNSHHPEQISGFNCGKESGFGYILLSYFTARALGFKRLPFCEDRRYTSALKNNADIHVLQKLDEKRVEAICSELASIYQHTQTKLKEVGHQTVYLRREIKKENDGYAETLVRLKQSADLLDLKEIQIEMDTLNSFGDEGCYCTSSGVTLELEIPIDKILYCSNLIANKEGENQLRSVETGEWVVVNSSPNGIEYLPSSAIKYKSDWWKETRPFSEEQAKSFMEIYKPIALRSRYEPDDRCNKNYLHPTIKQKLVRNAMKLLCRI